MATQPYWLVSSSSENGKPWNIIVFQGSASDAKGEGLNIGGYPKGPYTTLSALEAYAKANNIKYINDPAASSGNPVTGNENLITSSAGSAANALGIGSISGFLTALSSANTWIRVAKVTIGGVILIVGLAKLTGADQKAGSFAAKAIKAAPLL
jgi:hypothetical protein